MSLAAGKKVRTGLDDGRPPPKKAKTGKQSKTGGTDTTDTAAKNAGRKSASEKPPLPTIHPSESLSDFSRRVDAALPLSAAAVSGKGSAVKDPLGLAKPFRTRKEKKMHRLYEQWRAEEKRIQERREEEAEAAEEREWELQEQLGELKGMGMEALGFGTGKGAKRKRKGGGKRHDDDDDPWAELKRKRGESDRVPFNEVAKAPPDLFGRKGKGGKVTVDGVPRAAGSLRSREMLQEARTEVLERYRQMMKSGH